MHKPTCKISSLKQTSTQCAAILCNSNQTEHTYNSQVVDLILEAGSVSQTPYFSCAHKSGHNVPEAPTDVNLQLTSG